MRLKTTYGFWFICTLLAAICCQNANKVSRESEISENKIFHCMPSDTSGRNFKIEYLERDSFFAVKIILNGFDSLLPYRFDCSSPPHLVPLFSSSSDSVVCLRRGYGQHFNQFIVCCIKNERLLVQEFEIGLIADLKTNNIIYQNYDSLPQIFIENIYTGEKQKFIVSDSIGTFQILKAGIKDGNIWIEFADQEKVTVPYSNGRLSVLAQE